MITPMKKYTFLVYHKEYEEFLKMLGKLGVLHISEPVKEKKDETLRDKTEQLKRYDHALDILKNAIDDPAQESEKNTHSPEEILFRVEELMERNGRLEEEMIEIQGQIDKTIPWGDYDPGDFSKLRSAGYKIQLYHCPVSQFDTKWEEKYQLFIINKVKGIVYFLIVSKTKEDILIEAEADKLSSNTLSSLRNELEKTSIGLKEIQTELSSLSSFATVLLDKKRESLEDEISMISVFLDTKKSSDDKLMMLEGWIPDDSEDGVVNSMNEDGIVYFESVPDKNDLPPVLLKNNRFSKLFEPIGELYNLPGYYEMDLTPYFAPFFMIFFGFCLGDAGYGVFMIILASLLKLKAKKKLKPVLSLVQYMGIATIVFGLISGTFFGINLIDSGYTLTSNSLEELGAETLPKTLVLDLMVLEGEYFRTRSEFLAALEQQMDSQSFSQFSTRIVKHSKPGAKLFSSFRHLMLDSISMFYFALIIGGMQILFGFFIKIFNITKRRGFKYALSSLGWFIFLVSVIVYAVGGKLGFLDLDVIRYGLYTMMGIAGILIFVFNNPDKHILVRLGGGIWDSYGIVTGLFGDVLSYIRLFALGISSAILGFVFNDISLQFLNIPYIGWLFFLILLLVGHSINLFLATLGGIIHPMRLTFVEFYKNAGFQGGGKKYEPFKTNN